MVVLRFIFSPDVFAVMNPSRLPHSSPGQLVPV
jgi:hypothetical protein